MDGSQLPIGFIDAVDLSLAWLLVWMSLVWLRTARARLALTGLGLLLAVYLVAQRLELPLMTQLLQGFATAAVLIAIVVFQEDLRRFFEQLAVLGLRRGPKTRESNAVVDITVRAVTRLIERGQGATLVFPGRDPLERHLEGGIPLDAIPSEPLLLSLFDPGSPGHDGAVVIAGERLARFAAHLPLSNNHSELGSVGTRHAAALGLAERSDALCIVVSEERRIASIAVDGKLRQLRSPLQVAHELQRFLARLSPEQSDGRRFRTMKRWREALLAVPIAMGLWLLAVPGGQAGSVELEVPVQVRSLPQGLELVDVTPPSVRVVVEGARRDLFLLDRDKVNVRLNADLADLGRRTFSLTPSQVTTPAGLTARSLAPSSVRINLKKIEESPPQKR